MAAHYDGNGDGDGESEIFATHLLGHLACIDLPFGINKKSKQARAGPIINSNAANSNSNSSNSATATVQQQQQQQMQLQIICNLVVYLYLIYENDNKPTNAIYVFVSGQRDRQGHCQRGEWRGGEEEEQSLALVLQWQWGCHINSGGRKRAANNAA